MGLSLTLWPDTGLLPHPRLPYPGENWLKLAQRIASKRQENTKGQYICGVEVRGEKRGGSFYCCQTALVLWWWAWGCGHLVSKYWGLRASQESVPPISWHYHFLLPSSPSPQPPNPPTHTYSATYQNRSPSSLIPTATTPHQAGTLGDKRKEVPSTRSLFLQA